MTNLKKELEILEKNFKELTEDNQTKIKAILLNMENEKIKELITKIKQFLPLTQAKNTRGKIETIKLWQKIIIFINKNKTNSTLADKNLLKIESLSNQILLLSHSDIAEWEEEKPDKNFFLSNWLKEESILRAYKQTNGTKTTTVCFAVNKQAAQTVLGLGFMQSNWLDFNIKPEKNYTIIQCTILFDNMTNNIRETMNRKLDINIPLDSNTKNYKDELDLFNLELEM